ncbi:GH24 family phage-related lysozyme (muramidase) [Rhizobium azibense]|nr:GH24 family phage-related lysozyme (muramidase) [Rhizobium azibense]
MPINKLVKTKRGVGMVAAAMAIAATSGWTAFKDQQPNDQMTPAAVHKMIDQGITPPAVLMAVEVIKDWEGLRTTAYLDRLPKKPVWTVCYGETLGVKQGDHYTPAECEAKLIKRVTRDYFLPLVDGVKNFTLAPDSLQASLTSGGYNYGVNGAKKGRAAGFITEKKWRQACDAATAWNKAGGVLLKGLVNRREMGDRDRIGEGELCVSGQ